MDSTQIEAIERATVLAVSPDAQTEIAGWILPFEAGTVGRVRSAVPLTHALPAPSVLQEIEAGYAQQGLPVMLRIPLLPEFDAFRSRLNRQGYREETLTEVQIAPAAAVRAFSNAEPAELLTAQGSRGRGLAGKVLATLAAAIARGYDQVFLQVAAQNTAARFLYRRAGFTPVWSYSYWRRSYPQ